MESPRNQPAEPDQTPPGEEVVVHSGRDLDEPPPRWDRFLNTMHVNAPSRSLRWLNVLREGLRQTPYCVEATSDGQTTGLLPLMFVHGPVFGRFLVSLPYLNVGGVLAVDDETARALVDRAVSLADELQVRYLELRHEAPLAHPALTHQTTSKVHMRFSLPASADELWTQLKASVRNQVRKGERTGLTVDWGRLELLSDFYRVFSRNMRDLGTPVFSRRLFAAILNHFGDDAELCVVRLEKQTVASGLLVHGKGVTEVPSASSLRKYNRTNANMLMYWHLLQRAIERGHQTFDFGRSSPDSGTFRFKKQWGAQPEPATWQYYVRQGTVGEMRPENSRNQRLIRIWRRLPVPLTRWIGPWIVRGIP